MVSTGDELTLRRRDEIVDRARSSQTLAARRAGEPLRAALLDFASNTVLGAVPITLAGLGVVFSYPIVAYHGWVGGIVSVDRDHRTRFAEDGDGFYYVATLLLQLIPYSIAGGVGVRAGYGLWRAAWRARAEAWPGLAKNGLRDVAAAYVVIVPLFLIASLWEFLAR